MLEAPPGARPAGPSRSASGAEREALAAVPCLITMPVPGHGSRACFIGTGEPGIEVRPAWKVKAARAARLTLDFLGEKRAGGLLSVDCPVPVGLGLGSSTSDVVATIRAVCDAHGARIGPRELARLAVAAEGAIDPIMFEPGALFAPREGRVLQRWEGGCPEFLVLSVDTCPGGRGVDTLSLPVPRYGAADLDRYERLICRARMAFRERNAAEMAAVATASAQLNQRRVPMPGFTDLLALAREADGLGVQISHSGTVAGVLFDPAAQRATLSTLARALECIGMHCLGTFATTAAVSVARD